MTAALLHRAADLMLHRAQAATPGPWIVDGDDPAVILKPDHPSSSWDGTAIATTTVSDDQPPDYANTEHIAAWNPLTVVPVAEWLTFCADHHDGVDPGSYASAVKVARAYLQEES